LKFGIGCEIFPHKKTMFFQRCRPFYGVNQNYESWKKTDYQAEKSIFYKNMPNSNPKTARESIIMRI